MKLLVLFITLGIFAKGTSGNNQDTGLIIVDKEGDNNSSEIVTKPNVIKLDTSFEDEEDYNSEPFIPTKEWQVVKKGQSIPAGLHVRMNFQTHVREAKLMDGDDGARFYKDSKNTQEANEVKNEEKTAGPKIVLGDDLKKEENFGDPERLYFTKTHLKEALKDFRDKFHNEDLKTVEQEITRAEAVKKKFRSIEEIRKELGDSFGMQIKSDAQIMKLKIEVLKASNATEIERSNALEDLENYVHQIDNAVDLDKINGFEAVIQYLNHSVTKLQEKAAKVIGSAVQSNPKAQAAALKHDAIPHLLRLVSYSGDERLRKTSVFALSALVRTNPSGQVAFLKLDGLTHLLSLIDNHASPALRIKAITLISDLILEQEDVKQQMVKNGKMQQHQKTPFMKALIAKGWCELLPTQLGLTDHDSLEKLLSAIMASKSGCKNSFIKSGLKGKLNQIKQKYFDEINKEDDVDFKSYLKTFPDQITNITMDL